MIFSNLYSKLHEDSQHSGYPTTLETPRALGQEDYNLVAINADQVPGDRLKLVDGTLLKGSVILQNSSAMLQYAHGEGSELHIESVEVYRKLWNSIHIPKQSAQFIGKVK